MKKYNLLGIFLLGFLLMSTSFGLVAADDDDNDERDIQIKFSDHEVKIESYSTNDDMINEIEFKVKYDAEGLSIEVSYEAEFEAEDPSIAATYESDIEPEEPTEYELEFEVKFRKLIEFVDIDGNGMYNESIDQNVQNVTLNFEHVDVVYTTSMISTDTTKHNLIITTTDGVFAAHIFFVEEFTLVDTTLITPTQTKIDIEINNFKYIESNSQLALYVKLESELDFEPEDLTDEDGVVMNSNGYSGIFSWEETALVNGTEIMPVLSNTLDVDDDDEIEQKLILNYPRGNIYHDPKVGISLAQSSSSILPIVLTGTAVSIILIGIVVVVLIRKRRIA